MNFRNTFLLFALFLGVLWVFGLMLAAKRTTKDEVFILPTLHELQSGLREDDTTYQTVRVERVKKDGSKEEFIFTQKDGLWKLQVPPINREIRVKGHMVKNNIIQKAADAVH